MILSKQMPNSQVSGCFSSKRHLMSPLVATGNWYLCIATVANCTRMSQVLWEFPMPACSHLQSASHFILKLMGTTLKYQNPYLQKGCDYLVIMINVSLYSHICYNCGSNAVV